MTSGESAADFSVFFETTRVVCARGVLLGILVGVCRPVLKILKLFQTKKVSFSTTVFRPGL